MATSDNAKVREWLAATVDFDTDSDSETCEPGKEEELSQACRTDRADSGHELTDDALRYMLLQVVDSCENETLNGIEAKALYGYIDRLHVAKHRLEAITMRTRAAKR